MKKIFALLLTLTLVAGLCAAAYADDSAAASSSQGGLIRSKYVYSDAFFHQKFVSVDGGKTWVGGDKYPHDATILAGGTCACGYCPNPTPSPSPVADQYRYTRLNETQHTYQVSHDGGTTWEDVSVSSHSAECLAGTAACSQCGSPAVSQKTASPTASPANSSKPNTSSSPTASPSEKADVVISTENVENNYNGHYYIVVNESVSWAVAADAAENAGGYLACITSANELEYVKSLLDSSNAYWVGGYYVDSGWIWLDGSNWKFEAWNSGYPASVSSNPCCAVAGDGWINLNLDDGARVSGFVVEFDSKDDIGGIEIDSSLTFETSAPVESEAVQSTEEVQDIDSQVTESSSLFSSSTLIIMIAVAVIGAGIIFMLISKKTPDDDDEDDSDTE